MLLSSSKKFLKQMRFVAEDLKVTAGPTVGKSWPLRRQKRLDGMT